MNDRSVACVLTVVGTSWYAIAIAEAAQPPAASDRSVERRLLDACTTRAISENVVYALMARHDEHCCCVYALTTSLRHRIATRATDVENDHKEANEPTSGDEAHQLLPEVKAAVAQAEEPYVKHIESQDIPWARTSTDLLNDDRGRSLSMDNEAITT